ncbi:MAG: HAD-IB family hydrolase [Chloroflexota bacterium]
MREIIDSPAYQEAIGSLAKELSLPAEQVLKESETYLKEMYTTHNALVDYVGFEGSRYMLSRSYKQGIDVVPEQIEQISELMRDHTVAFVITHKTYLDTFVLSVALAEFGLQMPYTFGGINMSFTGAGQLGRRAGIIFIRRSFKDNLIYKTVLRQFISHLIKDKADFTWALEGTRSRTGKLVWPKLGILKYIAEGAKAAKVKSNHVKYVPVSIGYDMIPDVPAMTAEGQGAKKESESLSGVVKYFRRMGKQFGQVSIRFGEPVQIHDDTAVPDFEDQGKYTPEQRNLQKLAFELVHNINRVTPITTTSLVSTALLSKFNTTQSDIVADVRQMIDAIERRDPTLYVDFGKSITQSVQRALRLLAKATVVEKKSNEADPRYAINANKYLMAVYYSNMSAHQFLNGALIELALLHAAPKRGEDRIHGFWAEIMRLRDLFKFEFFYSKKPIFSDEVESELDLLDLDWRSHFSDSTEKTLGLLDQKPVLLAHAILYPYVETYRVVCHTLSQRNYDTPFDDKAFIQACMTNGEELHWQGKVQRVESISKPFIENGIRLIKNMGLVTDEPSETNSAAINKLISKLDYLMERMQTLQDMAKERSQQRPAIMPREIIPPTAVSPHADIAQDALSAPNGPEIGAFFDLDRTLIEGFSAKEFVQERLFSGQMSRKEIISQFFGLMIYAIGNRNFAGLAAIGARGVEGVPEKDLQEFGEMVYSKHLANAIYPESRALVEAHKAKGHTVAIISAATPYQVEPVARELGIEHVMCTRMEVKDGHFTGNIVDPPVWGEGKAIVARELIEKFNLDPEQSYFYTDSHEDLPLLELVGKPRPLNPDEKLEELAEDQGWPVQAFRSRGRPSLMNMIRTTLSFGSMAPALAAGLGLGALRGSRQDGTNAMTRTLGDLGTALAGIDLDVTGEENIWAARPAVFIFNHQSSADLLIGAKLLKKDATAIAKKELQYSIAGPLLMAGGVVFVDRGDKKKAIKALEPAVEALKGGTSIAIAPEGTRSKTTKLGKFKKGAFHMAMQAGVPIVPMVIKNAHDAMPKGSFIIRPSTIEVTVLPPIPTEHWTKDNLDERIAEVRSMFLRELGQVEEAE